MIESSWRAGVYNGLSWLLTDVEEPNPPWAAPLRGLCLNRGRVNWLEGSSGQHGTLVSLSYRLWIWHDWLFECLPSLPLNNRLQPGTLSWNDLSPKLPTVDMFYHSNRNEARRHGTSLPGSMTLAKTRGDMCYLRKGGWLASKVPFTGTVQKPHAAGINLNWKVCKYRCIKQFSHYKSRMIFYMGSSLYIDYRTTY